MKSTTLHQLAYRQPHSNSIQWSRCLELTEFWLTDICFFTNELTSLEHSILHHMDDFKPGRDIKAARRILRILQPMLIEVRKIHYVTLLHRDDVRLSLIDDNNEYEAIHPNLQSELHALLSSFGKRFSQLRKKVLELIHKLQQQLFR